MSLDIPGFGLKAYALFYSKFGTTQEFRQSELDWIVGESMKKKIFAVLLHAGWIRKKDRNAYVCNKPDSIMKHLLDFRVPTIIQQAQKKYAFTGLSAIEIWSDYAYIQRGIEKSPYYIQVQKKDISYWKNFFNQHNIPNYINEGSTIGEYIILIPVEKVHATEKNGMNVIPLSNTMKQAKENEIYHYAYQYMEKKYDTVPA